MLIMTPEKQNKTLELSKHWPVDSTPARNKVITKMTYPVKSIEQHFCILEPHHGCLHKVKKVRSYPFIKKGQQSHKYAF